MTTNLLGEEDSSCFYICDQSHHGDGYISEELSLITSLHVYPSSVDTNIYQHSVSNLNSQNCNEDYNLVPIDEEDEDILHENQEENTEQYSFTMHC